MNEIVLSAAADPLSKENYEHSMRVAKMLSTSELIPERFRGKPEQCMVALSLAQSLGVPALIAMQNIYVVHGTPSLKATFAIALANARGPFSGRISFSLIGDPKDRVAIARATMRSTGEIVEASVSMAMARAEGWAKNAKYASMGDQMLQYRAAVFLIRLRCPEVLLGFATSDEIEDVVASRIPTSSSSAIGMLNASIEAGVNAEIVDSETAKQVVDIREKTPEEREAEEAEAYFEQLEMGTR